MSQKITYFQQFIRINLVLTILLICSCCYGQKQDSLCVFLDTSKDSIEGIYLIFENRSADTLLIPAKFKNFQAQWETCVGLKINIYLNGNTIQNPIYCEFKDKEYYVFSKQKFIFILPNSQIKYSFNLKEYVKYIIKSNCIFIDFDINYIYIEHKKGTEYSPISATLRTNRVLLRMKS